MIGIAIAPKLKTVKASQREAEIFYYSSDAAAVAKVEHAWQKRAKGQPVEVVDPDGEIILEIDA